MSKIDHKLKIETLALHGGQEPDPTTGSRAVPVSYTHLTLPTIYSV